MDLLVVLIVILVLAAIWRGPKTIPQIGRMFGQGYRAARDEADRIRAGQGGDDQPDGKGPPTTG
jgi:Sec-independent protein translocase protein TatA